MTVEARHTEAALAHCDRACELDNPCTGCKALATAFAEWEARGRDAFEVAKAENWILRHERDRVESALRFLSTYEKNPPEIVKDDFAYDRLLDFVHEVARRGLTPTGTEGA